MSKKKRVVTLSGNKDANVVLTTKFKKNGTALLRIFEADPSLKIGGPRPNQKFYTEKKNKEALAIIGFPNRGALENMLGYLSKTRDIMIYGEGKIKGAEAGFNTGSESILGLLSELAGFDPEAAASSMEKYLTILDKAESITTNMDEILSKIDFHSSIAGATDEQKERIKELMRTGKKEETVETVVQTN